MLDLRSVKSQIAKQGPQALIVKAHMSKAEKAIVSPTAQKPIRPKAFYIERGFATPACATDSLATFKCDEAGRSRALARLDILDSASEGSFEGIVELVRQVLHVPISAVSLVDCDRQWFKAKRGLDVAETSRDISFCTHAINSNVPFIVTDATKDPLFANNPLVTGDPKIRSYVGVPLTTPEGYNIGTLCAIDVAPRSFSEHEIAILMNFAKVVGGEIELRQIASTDVLTGIMSRRAWLDCAEGEVSRSYRYATALSFIFLDIDHFKAINDRFGHPVGDQVIKELAQSVESQLRETDLFGRYGGEEFVAALPETNFADAMILAERIRAKIDELHFTCLGDQGCTISIGVANVGKDEASLKRVIERADQALFQAKKLGRNRIQGFGIIPNTRADRAAA